MIRPNIVVFGPAHVGKSTLIGYLAVDSGVISDWHLKVEKFKQELGQNYDKSQKYAYLLDTAKDERIKGANKGTTQRMRFMPYAFQENHKNTKLEWLLIDTPGTQHIERERLKGLHYGDLGIFIIEASKLLKFKLSDNDLLLEEFFAPLITWDKFEKTRKLIIAISKMDEIEFKQEVFETINDILKIIIGGKTNKIPIVPISIDVDSETECNITKKCKKISWYNGKPLVESIKHLVELSIKDDSSHRSFMSLDRKFEIKGHKLILRGKVLKGAFHVNQKIKISPVKLETGEFCSVEAKIQNIRQERGEDINNAREGDIVSLALVNLSKKNVKPIRSSAIVPKDTKLSMGRIIEVEIDSIETNSELHVSEAIKVLWFGRLLQGIILFIERNHVNNKFRVFIELEGTNVALPVDENMNFEFNKFYLKKEESDKGIYTNFEKTQLCNIYYTAEFIYDEQAITKEFGELHLNFLKNKKQLIYHRSNINKSISFQPDNDVGFYDAMKLIGYHISKKNKYFLVMPKVINWSPAKTI